MFNDSPNFLISYSSVDICDKIQSEHRHKLLLHSSNNPLLRGGQLLSPSAVGNHLLSMAWILAPPSSSASFGTRRYVPPWKPTSCLCNSTQRCTVSQYTYVSFPNRCNLQCGSRVLCHKTLLCIRTLDKETVDLVQDRLGECSFLIVSVFLKS